MIPPSLPPTSTFRNIHYLLLTLFEAQSLYSDPSLQKSFSLAGLQLDSLSWPSFVSAVNPIHITQTVSFKKALQDELHKPKARANHVSKLKL